MGEFYTLSNYLFLSLRYFNFYLIKNVVVCFNYGCTIFFYRATSLNYYYYYILLTKAKLGIAIKKDGFIKGTSREFEELLTDKKLL